MNHWMHLQVMSMFSGNSFDSTSSRMRDLTFQSILEATMASHLENGQSRTSVKPAKFGTFNQTPLIHTYTIDKVEKSGADDAPTTVDQIIDKAADRYGVDRQLIRSVVRAESNFKSNAVSHAGAQGLMQLMPATAKGLGVMDPFDPEQNVMGGTKYLKQMLDRYDGDEKLALAAYNAGPGNVDKYGGIPPFQETENYVRKILG
ncbi:lytic transglycosylase domain-containing protein [Halobacillus yeomjeoni]|uniref:lytic transglycosylase domain-containing protein n=1 Tax=Halobacillus yeomjeoni TaxID=311194 RepID=UPI00296ADB9B|nr:lytic transglycosylase domain-containing protein [Halobacillus yeomjeoni]